MELYTETNPAIDEWVPVGKDMAPFSLFIGKWWVGTNVFGLWIGNRYIFGFEFRGNSEPSVGVIVNNFAAGVWCPQDE